MGLIELLSHILNDPVFISNQSFRGGFLKTQKHLLQVTGYWNETELLHQERKYPYH